MSEGPNGPGVPRKTPQQHETFAPSRLNPSPPGPAAAEAEARPGLLLGAVALGFVTAGLEVLGGVLWILGGSRIGDIEAALGTGENIGDTVVLLGVVSLFVGAAYACGGLMALRHRLSVLFVASGAGIVLNSVALLSFEGVAGLIGLLLGVGTLLLSVLQTTLRPSRG